MKRIEKNFEWDNFNVQDLETKHRITEKANIDGQGNIPKTDSSSYSETENEIVLACNTYLERNTEKLRKFLKNIEEKIDEAKSYLTRNHFEEITNKLKADFNLIANNIELRLQEYKNEHLVYQSEKEQFKRNHQVYREPNSADFRVNLKTFTLIFSLLAIEVIFNSNLLAGALVGGALEGFTVAASVAFINVIISFIAGYNLFKNINHIDKAKKKIYIFFATIYLLLIAYVNLSIGAYRSVAESIQKKDLSTRGGLTEDQIEEAFRQSITFWKVDFSFVGIILTILGISFALIAILDGLIYNDAYPGFGKVGQKVNKLKNKSRNIFHEYSQKVAKLLASSSQDNQNQYKKLGSTDLDNWSINTNLIQAEFSTYISKINKLEIDTDHIILEYRNINSRVRKDPSPKYFAEGFVIKTDKKEPLKVFSEIKHSYKEDNEREEEKIKFSNIINEKFNVAEEQIKSVEKHSVDKQKELYEKYNIN